MTMQVIPTADAEGMNDAYLRGPMSHRMQLAALHTNWTSLKFITTTLNPTIIAWTVIVSN